MNDLRAKVLSLRGVPSNWSQVGNLPEFPETLREPIKELLQAMRLMRNFTVVAMEASPKARKIASEHILLLHQADAYLGAWMMHVGVGEDEIPWWEKDGDTHFSDEHPLLPDAGA